MDYLKSFLPQRNIPSPSLTRSIEGMDLLTDRNCAISGELKCKVHVTMHSLTLAATFSQLFVVNYGISSPRVISSALPERVETSTLAETS